MAVLVIAECGSNWNCDLSLAERMIREAKACGADVAKFQWTSDPDLMAERRYGPAGGVIIFRGGKSLGDPLAEMYRRYLAYPMEQLSTLKGMCDAAGIEFMCTVYLREDIAVVAPLVKRFKVSAFESCDREFIAAHPSEPIVSFNNRLRAYGYAHALWCVSKYPAQLEELHLGLMLTGRDDESPFEGLSDHSLSLISGAVAVGCGASIVEKHVRLWDTPKECPDYGHSLILDTGMPSGFRFYVRSIREAERMMG